MSKKKHMPEKYIPDFDFDVTKHKREQAGDGLTSYL